MFRGLVARNFLAPRRFYKDATVRPLVDSAFQILLDDRPIRTPARSELRIPSFDLARAIAEEFKAQEERIVPATMPLMTIASTALDVTQGNEKSTRDRILTFLETDTVSFLHENEPELRDFQKFAWDPLRSLANERFGVSTVQTEGLVLPDGQCPEGRSNLKKLLTESTDFWSLTTLEIASSYAKSAVISMCLLRGDVEVDAAVTAALAEEIFQRKIWGTVEGAHDLAERETAMWFAACRAFDELMKNPTSC